MQLYFSECWLQRLVEEVEEVSEEGHVHVYLAALRLQGDEGGHARRVLAVEALSVLGGVGLNAVQHPVHGHATHIRETVGEVTVP